MKIRHMKLHSSLSIKGFGPTDAMGSGPLALGPVNFFRLSTQLGNSSLLGQVHTCDRSDGRGIGVGVGIRNVF